MFAGGACSRHVTIPADNEMAVNLQEAELPLEDARSAELYEGSTEGILTFVGSLLAVPFRLTAALAERKDRSRVQRSFDEFADQVDRRRAELEPETPIWASAPSENEAFGLALLRALEGVCDRLHIPLERVQTFNSHQANQRVVAQYNPNNSTIRLLQGVHAEKVAYSCLHEFAHFLLHTLDDVPKRIAEIEAETTAYLVYRAAGGSSTTDAVEYVAAHSLKAPDALRKASHRIEDAVVLMLTLLGPAWSHDLDPEPVA
jgi:hypothetical protein